MVYLLAAVAAATTLSLSPWRGKDLPTASHAAAKYRLAVRGTPGRTVHLHAADVASGWLGAFCTSKVCSPGQTSVDIPSSGSVVVQFELIREDDRAAKTSGARILSDDGAQASVAVPVRSPR